MKKEILVSLSTAMILFVITTIFLTVRTIPSVQADILLKKSTANNALKENVNTALTSSITKTATPNQIDPSMAISIANSNAGLAIFAGKDPNLVDLNGSTAYEVIFNAGNIYVDASTGSILGDSIQIAPELAGQRAAAFLRTAGYTSVNVFNRNGINLYRVYFAQGIYVFVNFKGQVVAWEYAQPAYSNRPSNSSPSSNSFEREDD